MNHREQTPNDGMPDDGRLPEHLRWALRGLRRDEPPARDLWPDIAARLQALPQTGTTRARPIRNRFVPSIALAASLALAVGLAWQQRPAPGADANPEAQLISAEAEAMTREYQAALRELQGTAPRTSGNASLEELDRSAAQIRTALTRDPNARFLLARLHHTYAQRLDLTQRLALS